MYVSKSIMQYLPIGRAGRHSVCFDGPSSPVRLVIGARERSSQRHISRTDRLQDCTEKIMYRSSCNSGRYSKVSPALEKRIKKGGGTSLKKQLGSFSASGYQDHFA